MTDSVPASPFNCPNCKALYQVVKVEVPPVIGERQLICLRCGGPLNAREGRFALKYFFTDRSGRRRPMSSKKTTTIRH